MKCAALLIGIDDYNNYKKLNCAVRDVKDVANVLKKLKFEVRLLTDCTYGEAHKVVAEFVDNLYYKYDAAIFYFAGHGAMINRTDCLLMKDAPAFERQDDTKPKSFSLRVDNVMQEFNGIGDQANILIIDACRVCYGDTRGSAADEFGVALGKIPYQTFISFSTSPGTTADDGKKGGNSPFAQALLNHIEEENLDIEILFKKVRTDIKSMGHSQYPWEHTCLIDRFCFNYGQLDKYYDRPYSKEAFVRKEFRCEPDTIEDDIYGGLKPDETLKQNRSLSLLATNKKSFSDEFIFVIGRCVYNLAASRSLVMLEFLSKISNIAQFQSSNNNHFLKGIYYEIFFDDEDELREQPLGNTELLSVIESVREQFNDKDAESFVLKELPKDYSKRGYKLGETADLKFRVKLSDSDFYDKDWHEIMYVEDITVKNESIFYKVRDCVDNLILDWSDFREVIANQFSLPFQKIQVVPSIYKNDRWSRVLLSSELPDIGQLLSEICHNNTPSEIDVLSSLSYIEEVESISLSNVTQYEDDILVEGELDVSVHLEFDGEDAGSMSFPGKFSVEIHKNENTGKWEPASKKHHISINTEKYYK